MNNILVEDNKFKSISISITYTLPLIQNEASKNALVALVLEQGCDKYRSEKEISIVLAALYNSSIDVKLEKVGENYCITFCLEVLNKSYIKRDILEEGLDLLNNIIYMPYLEDGVFSSEYVKREKETLVNRINEIKNNKSSYAIYRLEEEMFKGEAFGVSKFGSVEETEKATSSSIYEQYLKIIGSKNINIAVVGNTDGYVDIIQKVKEKLQIREQKVENVYGSLSKVKGDLKNIEEFEQISQSTLCMGIRFENLKKEDVYRLSIYNAILGETPASKLFQNVREKESLAYTAKSIYVRSKGAIYIYTGIDIKNLEKAKEVILNQLEFMRDGAISDEEFEAAKKHCVASLKVKQDSKTNIFNYFFGNSLFFGGEKIEIEEMEKRLNSVTKQQVVEIAKEAYVDTMYLLGGKE